MSHQKYLTSALENSLNVSITSKKKKKLEDFEFIERNTKYGKTGELGKGAYGVVRLVKDKHNGHKYAMKIIKKELIEENNTLDQIRNEVKIQRKLDHPHIVRLKYFFEDKESVYLVLTYCENGTLYEHIRNNYRKNPMSEKEAFVYFLQTALALDYLHNKKVIHRDIKPENLLLDARMNIQLSDFGWSAKKKIDSEKRSTYCGTIDYMAPEMVRNSKYNEKVDIWSLGVLLFELTQSKPPFVGKNYKEKNHNILKCNIEPFKQEVSEECQDLVRKLLNPDALRRPSMDGIFNHQFIALNAGELGFDVEKQRKKGRNRHKRKRRKSNILGGLNNEKTGMTRNKSHSGLNILVKNPQEKTIDQILAADHEPEESGFGALSSQNHDVSSSRMKSSGHKKRKKKKNRKEKEKKTMYGLDECLDLLGGDDDELNLLNDISSTVAGKKSQNVSSRHIRTKDKRRDRSKSRSKSGLFEKNNPNIPPKSQSTISGVKGTKKGLDFGSSNRRSRSPFKNLDESTNVSKVFKHPPRANKDFEHVPEPEDEDFVLQESRNQSKKGTIETNFSGRNHKAPGPPPGYKKPSERLDDSIKKERPRFKEVDREENRINFSSSNTKIDSSNNMLSFGGPKSSRATGILSTKMQSTQKPKINAISPEKVSKKRDHIQEALFESGLYNKNFQPLDNNSEKKKYNFADDDEDDYLQKESHKEKVRESKEFRPPPLAKKPRSTNNHYKSSQNFEDLFSSRFRDRDQDDLFSFQNNKTPTDYMQSEVYYSSKNVDDKKREEIGHHRNYVIEEKNEEQLDEIKESNVKNRYRDDFSSGYGDEYEKRAMGLDSKRRQDHFDKNHRSRSNNAEVFRMDKQQASKWLNARNDPANHDMNFLPKHQRYRQVDVGQSYNNLLKQNELMKKRIEELKRGKGGGKSHRSQVDHNNHFRKTRRREKSLEKEKSGFLGRFQSFLDILGCTTGNRKME